MNSINIVGNLTRDPEKLEINGVSIAHLTIALNIIAKGKEDAIFLDVNAFGKEADFVGNYTRKGDKVAVTGRLSQDTYTNNEGKLVKKLYVIADHIDQLTAKKAQANAEPAERATAPANYGAPAYRRVK